MNRIEVNFIECNPVPPQGYVVLWREKGTADVFINAGTFYSSPAVFFDTTHIAGTQYEGYIQSQYPGLTCNQIPWETDPGSSGSSGSGGGNTINWNYSNSVGLGGRFKIFVNGVLVVNVTTSQSGTLTVNPGDVIEILTQSTVTGIAEIHTTGPYTNTVTTDHIAVDGFTVVPGIYFIDGWSH